MRFCTALILLSVSLSCQRVVYLPKTKAHYAQEIERLEGERETLRKALIRCYENGEALRRDCE